MIIRTIVNCATAAAAIAFTAAAWAASSANWKFDFGSGTVASGYIQVKPTTAYSSTAGYGFASTSGLSSVDRGAPDSLLGDYITGTSAFKFSANVPNGNYNVTVITGDNAGASDTSVKSEYERIAVENIRTTSGNFSRYTFTLHIRDGVMDLTFYGSAPKVNGVEIAAVSPIVLYLAGDSTVCDQTALPYAGWGQEFTSYNQAGLSVANYADSGESSASFWSGFYVPLVQPIIKAGDYLFVEFGHNDEKSLTTDEYKSWLQKYVDDAKAHGAHPVLVTPLERIVFSGSTLTWSHGAFPDAMKQVATANNVPCLDLTTMSHNLWQSLGQTVATTYFVSGDKTHTNPQGAMRVAALIRDGIRQLKLPIASYLTNSYQAEVATLSGGAGTETTNGGFDSWGYVNFPTSGGVCSFDQVDGLGGGSRTLTFRFANGGTSARTGQLTVNGTTSSITFPTTSSFTAWSTMNVVTTLQSGPNNTVKLQSNGQDLANVDSMVVVQSGGGTTADTYQAESAVLGGGTVAESTNTGFHGSGYANFPTSGGTCTFGNVDGNGGGAKTLTIRYANGSGVARTGQLTVNGVATSITFPATSSWTTWATLNVSISLANSTSNTIVLQSTGSDLANVDEITVP